MPSEKANALVLRVIDFSETSCIVTLFTEEFGKISALAKGGRRLKGPFESALDLLALCRIVFLRKSHGTLDLLTEAKLQRRFRPANSSLPNLYAAYSIAEFLKEFTDEYDAHPALFQLANKTIKAFSEGKSVTQQLLHFEMTALRLLGLAPQLDYCVECGSVPEPAKRLLLGLANGGVLCNQCKLGKKHLVMVSPEVVAIIKRYVQEGDAWQEAPLDSHRQGELRSVIHRYMANLAGHPLRMHKYLGSIV